jgi:ATP-dependent DNA ligase
MSGLANGVLLKAPRPHYQAGRSNDWIKMKNRSHPALERVKDAFS